jgi:type IX secretion system PorP/SprF family membrane protein
MREVVHPKCGLPLFLCKSTYFGAVAQFLHAFSVIKVGLNKTTMFLRDNILYIFLFFACTFISNTTSAQFDGQISQYMLAPGGFNPAVAGENNEMLITIQNRQQWVGIENAGNTLLANASIPLTLNKQKQGLGIIIGKESIGLFSTQTLQVQYAWRKLFSKGTLSLGIQGGILQEGFDASSIYIPSSDYHTTTETDMPTGTLEGDIPDFSAGIWYRAHSGYVGLSASHLLETTINLKQSESDTDDDNSQFIASRTYYLTNGYNIALTTPFYTLQPSFLLKTDLAAWQIDVSAKVLYKEKYWGGIGYRYGDAVVLMAGVKLQQGLCIGYSYDIATSAVAQFSSGSHELFLSYSRKIGTATVSKRQKSVRIL